MRGYLYRVIKPGWLRAPAAGQRKSARRLTIEYATALALAYVLAVADAAAILIPLRGHTSVAASNYFAEKNKAAVLVLVALGIVGVAVGGAGGYEPELSGFEVVSELRRQT